LDDLKRPKRTIVENIVLRNPPKMNEDSPILSAAQCRPMIRVSRNIVIVRIFPGVP